MGFEPGFSVAAPENLEADRSHPPGRIEMTSETLELFAASLGMGDRVALAAAGKAGPRPPSPARLRAHRRRLARHNERSADATQGHPSQGRQSGKQRGKATGPIPALCSSSPRAPRTLTRRAQKTPDLTFIRRAMCDTMVYPAAPHVLQGDSARMHRRGGLRRWLRWVRGQGDERCARRYECCDHLARRRWTR